MRVMMDNPWIFTVMLVFLAVMLVLCLIRAIKGPAIADRVVAVNMMGTMDMVIIAILAVKMDESYLLDICLIYAMISFLAVVVLTKVYSGVYLEKLAKTDSQTEKTNGAQVKESVEAAVPAQQQDSKGKAEENR